MNLIKLTSKSGNAPVYINPHFIKRIYVIDEGCDIDMVSDDEENYHYVKESIEEVLRKIDGVDLTRLQADLGASKIAYDSYYQR